MTRSRAAQACINRFNGRAYEPGKRDCLKLFLHALHQCGVAVPAAKGVRYSTEAGALKALRKAGFKGLAEAIDSLGLERIAPARAMTGDIVALPANNPAWDCVLTVAVGNGRLLGFTEGRCQVVQVNAYVTAWRLPHG